MSRPEWCNRVNNVNRSFGAPPPLPKKREGKTKPMVDCHKPISMNAPIRKLSLQRVQEAQQGERKARGSRPGVRTTRMQSAQAKSIRTGSADEAATRPLTMAHGHGDTRTRWQELDDDMLTELDPSQRGSRWRALESFERKWQEPQKEAAAARPTGSLWQSVYDACQEAGVPLTPSLGPKAFSAHERDEECSRQDSHNPPKAGATFTRNSEPVHLNGVDPNVGTELPPPCDWNLDKETSPRLRFSVGPAAHHDVAETSVDVGTTQATLKTLESSWHSPPRSTDDEEPDIAQPSFFFREPVVVEASLVDQATDIESNPLSSSCAYSDTFEGDSEITVEVESQSKDR